MPSWPIAMPSSTAMVSNSLAAPPAASTSRATNWPRSLRCTWPGTNWVKELAMAMIGLPKSPSFMPVARQRPRAPAILRPWVEVRERYGGMGSAYGVGKGAQQRQLTVIFAFFLSPQQGRAYDARERDPESEAVNATTRMFCGRG